MAKKDIAVTISAADRLLETLTDPLHRRIIENYRRHAILEVCGEWELIFEPEMTVERPVYYLNIAGYSGVRNEGEGVKAVYESLAENATSVIMVEDEHLAVADWGFASNSMFNTYYRGAELNKMGQDADPDGYYVFRQNFAMIWPYDDHGRLIGEHVYENPARQEVLEVAPEDFLTIEDAQTRLLPMLRPLPAYDPASRSAPAPWPEHLVS